LGAVYRKYKASVEMSAGGRVYTEDSGPEVTTLVQSRPLPSNAMRDWA
jgi:hypothetical protein